jgi:hypothetical protein
MTEVAPGKECPSPTKSRYATEETASRAARNILIRPGGLELKPYLCDCGWYHLTKTMNEAEQVPDLPPADEGDAAWLLRMSDEEFAQIVKQDIHRTAPVHYSAALRHLAVVHRWEEFLRLEAQKVNAQLAARAGRKDAATADWRARVAYFQTALKTRKDEARRLMNLIDSRTFQDPDKYANLPLERLNQSELRAIAGERAIRQLMADHYAEFTRLLLLAYRDMAAEAPARIVRWAQEHGVEIPEGLAVVGDPEERDEELEDAA